MKTSLIFFPGLNSNNSIRNKLLEKLDVLHEDLIRPKNQRLFQKLIYVWFLGHAIYLLPAVNMLWGPDALLMPMIRQGDGAVKNVIYILNYLRSYNVWVFAIHLSSAVLALLGVGKFIPRVLLLVSAWMLYYSAIPAFNSGFLLMMLFASFAIFMSEKPKSALGILSSNVAFIAAMVQFVIVYFVAAVYKFEGTTWLNGTSLHYVLQYRPLVSVGPAAFLLQFPKTMAFLTYVGLAYQAGFPVLIWFKRVKRPLLIVGLCFHLFIGLVMHLWDFALAMIFAYSLFIDLPKSKAGTLGNIWFRKGN